MWNQFLEKNYFDPGNPASFGETQSLYRYLKQEGNFDVRYRDIVKWLKSKDAYSLHRQTCEPKKHSRVLVEIWI